MCGIKVSFCKTEPISWQLMTSKVHFKMNTGSTNLLIRHVSVRSYHKDMCTINCALNFLPWVSWLKSYLLLSYAISLYNSIAHGTLFYFYIFYFFYLSAPSSYASMVMGLYLIKYRYGEQWAHDINQSNFYSVNIPGGLSGAVTCLWRACEGLHEGIYGGHGK